MPFTQKIYYNNKPLILTDNANAYMDTHVVSMGYMLYEGAFPRNFRLAVQHLDKPGTLGAIIEDESPESLQKEMHKIYTPIMAGGGVVTTGNNDVLMIFRRGKWDLPKGKLDEGEDIAACAVREVSEETGLRDLTLQDKICDTYHVYSQNGESLLKHTVWYHMKGNAADKLTPQKEENILDARWVKEKELPNIIYKSYDAIREVLQQAGFKW
jgi:ADP-ribose pyrophosphatase YjhB (NUDIX family)